MSEFNYILENINKAEFKNEPFRHLEINNFLSEEHLNMILSDNQIHFNEVVSDDELIKELEERSYEIECFPGCTIDKNQYLDCLKKNKFPVDQKILEGFGLTYRLKKYNNPKLNELMVFLNSQQFQKALEKKFNLRSPTTIISAIQKYLTKYEISPHPDIRQKALTYLLNINKDDDCENYPIHTHLLKYSDKYSGIYEFWEKNLKIDRCWVPWDWCNSITTLSKNNTMLIFAPSNDTLHAIKLDYDHKKFQRTQIYGNLMYTKASGCRAINYKNLTYLENNNVK